MDDHLKGGLFFLFETTMCWREWSLELDINAEIQNMNIDNIDTKIVVYVIPD